SGSYLADGNTTGGAIEMLTQEGNILLLGAYLSSQGPLGGGAIRIGGDFHGANTLRRNSYTTVDANTRIYADATDDGDGGTVAIWSDIATEFDGSISAKGGPNNGDGGYVETSGENLIATGTVNASAPHGNAGLWLLDPNNIDIEQSSCTGTSCSSANAI